MFGAEILIGKLRQKTPIINEEGKRVGIIHQIQDAGKNIDLATSGMQVALSMKEPTIGRQINEGDIFYTDLRSKEAKLLIERFDNRLSESKKKYSNIYLQKNARKTPRLDYCNYIRML